MLCVLSQKRKSYRHIERQKIVNVSAGFQMAQQQSDAVVEESWDHGHRLVAYSLDKHRAIQSRSSAYAAQ